VFPGSTDECKVVVLKGEFWNTYDFTLKRLNLTTKCDKIPEIFATYNIDTLLKPKTFDTEPAGAGQSEVNE